MDWYLKTKSLVSKWKKEFEYPQPPLIRNPICKSFLLSFDDNYSSSDEDINQNHKTTVNQQKEESNAEKQELTEQRKRSRSSSRSSTESCKSRFVGPYLENCCLTTKCGVWLEMDLNVQSCAVVTFFLFLVIGFCICS